jgi:hypothetical protein
VYIKILLAAILTSFGIAAALQPGFVRQRKRNHNLPDKVFSKPCNPASPQLQKLYKINKNKVPLAIIPPGIRVCAQQQVIQK